MAARLSNAADASEIVTGVSSLTPLLEKAYRSLLPEQNRANELGKLSWRLRDNPAGAGMIAHAQIDGRVVGLSTYVPAELHASENLIRGYQAIDSIVDPSLRGRGVFTRLATEFWNHLPVLGGGAVYGFPNANAAPAWFGSKLSWTRLPAPPVIIKPLRLGYALRRLGLPGDVPLSIARDHHAPPLPRFGEAADVLWERTQSVSSLNGVRRSSKYLNWRIFDAPAASYRTVGSGESYVCSWVGEKHGGRIGYIMEALGPEARDLLASELGKMRDEGVEVVLAWSFPHAPNYRAFRGCGFFPLPERLRPIEMHFGIRTALPASAPLASRSNWYLSYLDSDTV